MSLVLRLRCNGCCGSSFPPRTTYHTDDFLFWDPIPVLPSPFALSLSLPAPLYCFQLFKSATFHDSRLSISSQIMQPTSFTLSCFMLSMHPYIHLSIYPSIHLYIYTLYYISSTYDESSDVRPSPKNWTLQLGLGPSPLAFWVVNVSSRLVIIRACYEFMFSLSLVTTLVI